MEEPTGQQVGLFASLIGQPRARSNTQPVYVDLEGRLTASLPGPTSAEYRYRGSAHVPVTAAGGRMHIPIRISATAFAAQARNRPSAGVSRPAAAPDSFSAAISSSE